MIKLIEFIMNSGQVHVPKILEKCRLFFQKRSDKCLLTVLYCTEKVFLLTRSQLFLTVGQNNLGKKIPGRDVRMAPIDLINLCGFHQCTNIQMQFQGCQKQGAGQNLAPPLLLAPPPYFWLHVTTRPPTRFSDLPTSLVSKYFCTR